MKQPEGADHSAQLPAERDLCELRRRVGTRRSGVRQVGPVKFVESAARYDGQKGNPGLCAFTTSLVRSLH